MAGLRVLERIQRHGSEPVPASAQTALQTQQRQKNLARTTGFHESRRVRQHVEECRSG